jgi:purine nucleosidase
VLEKTLVLFDTDIGSDIDDALALAYLLKHPQCELLGITTVSGDVQQRAALAEMLCRAVGRHDVPIHCGRREVLVDGPGQPNVPQYKLVADLPHRMNREENTAVDFMRKTIRQHLGKVVLLTVGPYSNVATLFALDPEIPSLLKGIVSMGGIFLEPGKREWNALVDPTATSITYAAKGRKHLSVGLDVTMKCGRQAHDLKPHFAKEPLATVAKMAQSWLDSNGEMIFHDPLATALIFHPGLCEYKSGSIHVSLTNDQNQSGATVFTEGAGEDRIAVSVAVDAFFEEYFSITER